MGSKRIHCQEEFDQDRLSGINYGLLMKWFEDEYSTSKHVFLLYSLPIAMKAKKIGEIGFGRSTLVLGFVAYMNQTTHIVCDRYDYEKYILHSHTRFIKGTSDKFFSDPEVRSGMDFVMLDYFSTRKMSANDCYREIKKTFRVMRQNGFIAIHDTIEQRYNAKDAIKMFYKKHCDECEMITIPACFGMTLIRRTSKSRHGKLTVKSVKKEDKK